MATTFFSKANRVYSTLDGSLTDIALSCVVTTATGYNDHPATNHTIQVGDDAQGYEIMTATSSGGANPTLTIVRAREGTGALPFNAGTDVKLVITAAQVVEYETALNLRVEQAASSTDNAIARFDGVDGDLVQNSQATVDDNGAIKVSGGAASVIAFEGESGHANNYCAWSLGRTAAEFQGAIIHQANSWYNPSAVGDGVISVLDNTKSLRLGVGNGVAQLVIANTAATFSGNLTLSADNAVLAIGADHTARGFLYLYGDAATDSPTIRFYNAANEDGAEDYWDLTAGGTNFFLGPVSDTDEFIFTNVGNLMMGGDLTVTGNNISDAGGVAITFDGAGNVSAIDIDGGSIDGTPIGAASTSTGVFSTLESEGDMQVGAHSKMLAWVERALTVGIATNQAGIEIVGNVSTDTVAANLSFHNKASTRADERIANISAERDGDDEAGRLILSTTDSDGNLDTAVTIDSSQLTTFSGNIELANGQTFLRGVSIISQAITWDGGATQACATVADGYVVVDVYIEITTTFDGDAVVTVGDGADPDGFLTDAGIDQGVAGYYGQDVSLRGVYILGGVAGGDRKIYTGADTVDAFVTETTATQGAATVYTVIQRLK